MRIYSSPRQWMAMCILLISAYSLSGQKVIYDGYPDVYESYYIQNAFIKANPQAKAEIKHLLIKNGKIDRIDIQSNPPADAKVIEADSMYVYPGFICAASSNGLKRADRNDNRNSEPDRDMHPGYPPAEEVGITPWISIRESYEAGDNALEKWRGAGFTTMHIVPEGLVIPGQGSVVSNNESDFSKAVLQEDYSVYAQFRGRRGYFPSTQIGVMSTWRDLINQARQADKHHKMFASDATKASKPSYAREVESLIPVANKNKTVFFDCPDTKSAYRIMALSQELGFNVALTGLPYFAGDMAKLNAPNVSVILSLEVPEVEKKDEDAVVPVGFSSEEVNQLTERTNKAKMMHLTYPGQLAKQKIPFSFSTEGAKSSDFLAGIRALNENGLSEADLLAGLTTHPAKLLGVSGYAGSIDKGKLANLVIFTGPMLDKESGIKYVVSEGKLYEYTPKKKKEKAAVSDQESLVGNWNYNMSFQGQDMTGLLEFTLEDGNVNGTITNSQSPNTATLDDISFDGKVLIFTYTIEEMNLTIDVNAELIDNQMEGSFSNQMFGDIPFTAEKDPK